MPVARWRAPARLVVLCSSLVACGGGGAAGGAAASAPKASAIVPTIDSIVDARLKTGQLAGVSVGVMKGADTIVMKAYGKADLELDVATPPHAVYEIGSVTKQFTAAAILQLRDAGKLSLDDNITKYLPGYNTQGNTITVRHLLNHTSGIKGYTEMPVLGAIIARDLPRDTLVTLFSREKFDFPTGTGMIYNNSAYFLAGLIIEKLSGQSYPAYVKEHFYDKVGMKDGAYCSEKVPMKGKVKGYDVGPDPRAPKPAAGDTTPPKLMLLNKGFLVHTWPYSAGSLCASIYDLVAWNRALHNGQVLPAASYTDITTPSTLKDGTALRYAMGLAIRNVGGHRLIEHGGGINGFLSASHYYPDDSLTVVVLENTAGPVAPDAVATDIALAILGKKETPEVPYTGDLAALAGTYTGAGRGQAIDVKVAVEGKGLTVQFPGAPKPEPLRFIGNDTWEHKEDHVFFTPAKGGMQMRADQTYGVYFLTKK